MILDEAQFYFVAGYQYLITWNGHGARYRCNVGCAPLMMEVYYFYLCFASCQNDHCATRTKILYLYAFDYTWPANMNQGCSNRMLRCPVSPGSPQGIKRLLLEACSEPALLRKLLPSTILWRTCTLRTNQPTTKKKPP